MGRPTAAKKASAACCSKEDFPAGTVKPSASSAKPMPVSSTVTVSQRETDCITIRSSW